MHHTEAPLGEALARNAILRACRRIQSASPGPVTTPDGHTIGMVRPSPGSTYIGTLDETDQNTPGIPAAFTHAEAANPQRAAAHVLTEYHRQTLNALHGPRPHHPHSIRKGQAVTLPAHRTETTVHITDVSEYDETWTVTDTNGAEWDLTVTDRVRIHP